MSSGSWPTPTLLHGLLFCFKRAFVVVSLLKSWWHEEHRFCPGGGRTEGPGSTHPAHCFQTLLSSKPLCRRKEAMETEESIRYGLYTTCPTQQQTVSKAVLEATPRAASISTVLAWSWALHMHRGQAHHQHLILHSLRSLLLSSHPSPTILLSLLLSPRCCGCLLDVWLSPWAQVSAVDNLKH